MVEGFERNYAKTAKQVINLDDLPSETNIDPVEQAINFGELPKDRKVTLTKTRAELIYSFKEAEKKHKESHSEWKLFMMMEVLELEMEEHNIQDFLKKDDVNIFEAMNDIAFLFDLLDYIMDYKDEDLSGEELEQKKDILRKAIPFLKEIYDIYVEASVRMGKDQVETVNLIRELLEDRIENIGSLLEQYR